MSVSIRVFERVLTLCSNSVIHGAVRRAKSILALVRRPTAASTKGIADDMCALFQSLHQESWSLMLDVSYLGIAQKHKLRIRTAIVVAGYLPHHRTNSHVGRERISSRIIRVQ